jgi:hypothetical protein
MYDENVIDGLKRLDRVEEAHRPMCDPGELQRLVDRLKSPDIHAIHFVAGGTIQTFPTDRVFPSATITLDDLRELISDVTKDQPAEGPKPEGPGPVPEVATMSDMPKGTGSPEYDKAKPLIIQEYERLKAENERLREALDDIENHSIDLAPAMYPSEDLANGYAMGVGSCRRIAREALRQEGGAE